MKNEELTPAVIALLRRFWDLSDVTDAALLPEAQGIVDAVRRGRSDDALVADITDLLFVRLVKPVGNRAQLPRLAALIRDAVVSNTP